MKSESEKFQTPPVVEPGHMSELHPLVNRNLYLYEIRIERNKEFVVAQADGSLQLQVGCQRYRDHGHRIQMSVTFLVTHQLRCGHHTSWTP